MSNETERARGPLTDHVLGDRYRLGTILGQGGMGVVYTATQVSLDRPVAIKVLQPGLAQHVDAIARFRAEAERAGRLAHPHIVQILDFGREADGSAWIAMELLAGQSLASRIAAGPMSEAEVVRVALETLSALEAAHGASLVHRDLKPDNIFLASVAGIGASVKVLDFGIAKLLDADPSGRLTATGALVGTPLYMSPEQARGAEIDPRSDLYSLGALLYEALTLRPPFTGGSYAALLLALMTDTPRPMVELRPEVTAALAAIVARAMEKSPSDRFATATEMSVALRALSPSESVPTRTGANDLSLAMAATMTPEPGASLASTPPTRAATTAPIAAPSPVIAPAAAAVVPPTPAAAGPGRTVIAAVGGAIATLAIVAVAMRIVQPPTPPERVALVPPTTQPATTQPVTTDEQADDPRTEDVETRTVLAMLPMEPPSTNSAATIGPVAPAAILESPPARQPPSAVRERDPEITRHVSRARRRFTPRVTLSSLQWGGMSSRDDLRGPIHAAGGWAQCWPSEEALPVSRGRDFLIDIAADGSVTGVSPAPQSEEPAAFARCVAARLRTLTFPPPSRGSAVRVRVGFGIE